MHVCYAVRRALDRSGIASGLPAALRDHVQSCATCRNRLAAAQLVQQALADLGRTDGPPLLFVARVVAAIRRHPALAKEDVAPWRAAWGLVPAFSAIVLLLYLVQPVPTLATDSEWFPAPNPSTTEQLMIDTAPPAFEDLVAAAVPYER